YQAYDDGRKLTIGEENEMRTRLEMSQVHGVEIRDKFQNWFNKQFADGIAEYNKQVEDRGTFAETVSKPEGEEYEVHVLEFDWNYEHKKDECSSKEHALERLTKWQKTFYWADFSNIKIYKEIRYRTKIEEVEDRIMKKEIIIKSDSIETIEDLAKVSGTFAAEMKLKRKKKK
ncbi:hypothetical protein LCGC14_1067660, partial [marine sediment metagenome]